MTRYASSENVPLSRHSAAGNLAGKDFLLFLNLLQLLSEHLRDTAGLELALEL